MRLAGASAAVAARPGARFRLGRHPRRVALVVHLASAGGWLGIDIAVAVVIVTATTTRDAATRSSCLLVLELITVWPLLGCGLACLLSGLVLGLGSKWGVLRYWWVAVKLDLNSQWRGADVEHRHLRGVVVVTSVDIVTTLECHQRHPCAEAESDVGVEGDRAGELTLLVGEDQPAEGPARTRATTVAGPTDHPGRCLNLTDER
jgi:hypothetical protein